MRSSQEAAFRGSTRASSRTPATGDRSDGPRLLTLAGESRGEVMHRLTRLRERLESRPAEEALLEVSESENGSSPQGDFRLSLVAGSAAEVEKRVRFAAERLADPARRSIHAAQGVYFVEPGSRITGQLAFLFPGEGSQYPGMLGDLRTIPEIRAVIEQMDTLAGGPGGGVPLSTLLFPPPGSGAEEKRTAEARLWEMEPAVQAVLTADFALFRLLTRFGIRPDALLGHSTGEFAALMLSGSIDVAESEWAGFAREFASIPAQVRAQTLPPTALFAVGASAESAAEVLREVPGSVHVGMDNCPHQAVMVVEEPQVGAVTERLRERGIIFERLRFDRPYHTPLFAAYAPHLADFFARWISAPPAAHTYTCTSAAPFPAEVDAVRDLAVRHWTRPVRFRETVERMHADGIRFFVEVGAKGNLSAFVDDILRGKPHLAVPADVPRRSGRLQLCHLLGILVAHDVPVDLGAFDLHENPPDPPARDSLAMNSSPADSPSGLPAAPSQSLVAPAASSAAPAARQLRHYDAAASTLAAAGRDPADSVLRVMAGHLELMSHFLAVQQEVMRSFLTGAPAPRSNTTDVSASAESGTAWGLGPTSTGMTPATPVERPPSVHEDPRSERRETTPPAAETSGEAPERLHTPEAADSSPATLTDTLLTIVSERTGYPVEMLDLNLDLEADLGIDSIKRVEILSSLQQQTQALVEVDMEALSAGRTLQEIIELLTSQADYRDA